MVSHMGAVVSHDGSKKLVAVILGINILDTIMGPGLIEIRVKWLSRLFGKKSHAHALLFDVLSKMMHDEVNLENNMLSYLWFLYLPISHSILIWSLVFLPVDLSICQLVYLPVALCLSAITTVFSKTKDTIKGVVHLLVDWSMNTCWTRRDTRPIPVADGWAGAEKERWFHLALFLTKPEVERHLTLLANNVTFCDRLSSFQTLI